MSDDALATAMATLRGLCRPPPKLNLADWADANFVLSAENSAEAGRWKTIPYQRGILNALSDPSVKQVSFMKSARVGATKMMCVAVAYYVAQDPSTILFVQPTIEAAAQFSKEEIAVMFRDVPALQGRVSERAGDAESTIAQKMFPGGSLQLVGANSGNGFRRVSRRNIFLDEVDSYPPSAGQDGDPVRLAIRRSEFYWNRKIFAASTPLVDGSSRIQGLFNEGDQRYYYVPCPQCGHMDRMVFSEQQSGGHFITWEKNKPETAYLVCSKNGCAIEHAEKRGMIERGEWRASRPFKDHASFHISALYSYSPNSSWADIVKEFLEVKDNTEQLRQFVNTVLGETWKERGDAPEWQRLYNRREAYELGSVPDGVKFLTAGVDVQKDRFVWEIVGWGEGKQSWTIDVGEMPGDTSNDETFNKLDGLLNETFVAANGNEFTIRKLAIDSGYQTQMVYNWARRHVGRVMAVKGVDTAKVLVGTATAVDVNHGGKRIARGCKMWPVGSSIAKQELYGWLRLESPDADGFCHFPMLGEEYFKQLTAEHLVPVKTRTGYIKQEWQQLPNRQNHWLDARVYARAAANTMGLDRMRKRERPAAPVVQSTDSTEVAPVPRAPAPSAPPPKPRPRSNGPGWLGKDSRFHVQGWLGKRR